MDDSDPYPALLGIDWDFDNNVVLNFKKRQMSFVTDTLCVIAPLDPYEGDRYNDLVDGDARSLVIENIYKIIVSREDYINPTTDGKLSWRSVKSYDTDSEEAMDRWKNNLYEISTRCVRITKAVCWIGITLCDTSVFDGTGRVQDFLSQMEKTIPKDRECIPWMQ
jgi:hypothetical protein